MKWEGRRQSKNFEDRRGMSTTAKVATGGGLIGVVFLIIQMFMGGGDSAQLVNALQQQLSQGQSQSQPAKELTAEQQRDAQFVATVLADTEDVWNKIFAENGAKYREPKMVLFSDAVQSACGGASSSSGPFYCAADETIYMDLSFFKVLTERFGAKNGEFTIAYVIAHEVGHHVQKLTGVLQKVHQVRANGPKKEGQRMYIAMELQADFYAGVFAHYISKYLSQNDIEIALSAAAAVGDDNIQKRTQGYVVEESFTHGTSEQRQFWLAKGMKTGDISQGNTFDLIQ